ncbi:hypothetical protein ABZT43_30910 [Streptomyces sp. NPDC005349]|uniref:hypothetical protein n=1 Tax=Streptomyces sp. NPDC005349 TaxID=3157037 RepID=UPI0033AED41C
MASRLSRNQLIAIFVPIVCALIGLAGVLLAKSGGGSQNNCRDSAQCAQRDNVNVEKSP